MAKIKRRVEVFANDGISLTAEELMQATVQMPPGMKPRVNIKMNGEIKSIYFQAEIRPDASK
jgi:hypothetical protein